jgi:hypothetical protein
VAQVETKIEGSSWCRWGSYNKVKHRRNLYFAQANLQNVLLPRRGLYVALFSWYHLESNGRYRLTTFHIFDLDEDVKELIMKARAFRIGPFSEDTKMAATCDSFGGGKIPLGQLAGWGRPADCVIRRNPQ